MFGWGAPPPAANEVAQLAAKSSLKSKKKGDKKVGKKPAGDNPLVRKIRPTGRPLPPPHEPFQPGKYEHEDRMMVDYVRFMTAENVWYYRYALAGRSMWRGRSMRRACLLPRWQCSHCYPATPIARTQGPHERATWTLLPPRPARGLGAWGGG